MIDDLSELEKSRLLLLAMGCRVEKKHSIVKGQSSYFVLDFVKGVVHGLDENHTLYRHEATHLAYKVLNWAYHKAKLDDRLLSVIEVHDFMGNPPEIMTSIFLDLILEYLIEDGRVKLDLVNE